MIRRNAAGLMGLCLLLMSATGALAAQSSTVRQVRVPFGAPSGGDGYRSGSVAVQYAFLNCYGELHLAYGLVNGTAQSDGVYMMGGKTYEAKGGPPQPSSIELNATARRAGAEVIGSMVDKAAGPALGMGCFSGQLSQMGTIAPWLGPKPTPQQVTNFLNTLTLDVQPSGAVRDAGLEARLRADDRQRQEGQAALERRNREAAEARRVAEAKRAEDAKRPISPAPTGPGGGYASTAPSTAPAPRVQRPLTDNERRDRAIASDKVLEQQRLAQDQEKLRQFQQQMANNEVQRQRQNQAVIAAAPALIELGGALQTMSDNFERKRFETAQARQGNRCLLANGAPSPKDGDLQLGVPIRSALQNADCGLSVGDRFEAFKLELREKTRVRIIVANTGLMDLSKKIFMIQDLNNQVYVQVSPAELAPIQRTVSKTVDLAAGLYILRVHNEGYGIFSGFEVRVDAVDTAGRMIATAPALPPAPRPGAARPAQLNTPPLGAAMAPASPLGGVGGLAKGLAPLTASAAGAGPRSENLQEVRVASGNTQIQPGQRLIGHATRGYVEFTFQGRAGERVTLNFQSDAAKDVYVGIDQKRSVLALGAAPNVARAYGRNSVATGVIPLDGVYTVGLIETSMFPKAFNYTLEFTSSLVAPPSAPSR